jgi:CO/xanthine dehydrogenase Mo-binding subunit
MVVAQSREAAKDAADLIEVEYDELPVIIGFEGACSEACVHSGISNNICFDFEYGDAAKAELIGSAEHVVRMRMESPRVAPLRWSCGLLLPGSMPSATRMRSAVRIRARLQCATRLRP